MGDVPALAEEFVRRPGTVLRTADHDADYCAVHFPGLDLSKFAKSRWLNL